MKDKINTLIILLLLLIGFFFPTSSSGIISTKYVLLHTYLLSLLLFILLIINKTNKKTFIIALSINIILLLATLMQTYNTSTLDRISWGSYPPYLSLSLLYPISVLRIKYSPVFTKAFVLINLLNIALGTLIIYDFLSVKNFVITHYSMGYPDLVYNMLYNDKPVNMFGSHAIASNFYFILFYMSFQTFVHTKKKFYLVLAIADLFLISSLNSVSAYLLLAVGIFLVFLHFTKKYNFLKLISIPIALIVAIFFVYNPSEKIQSVFSSQQNGFLGRYSNDGVFADTIGYITNNLLPIGLWFSDDLFFTDSGFIVNFLKGSIFLVVAIYLGLFLLIKHNIKNKRMAYTLFGIICLFEIGYTLITFNRMVSFMPFILLYLNHLSQIDQETKLKV